MNSIRQPLIGKDLLIPCKRKTSYRFVAYFYFVINTFYHSIAVIILSERALWCLFLLSKLFLFVVICRLLGSGCLHY